MEVKNTGINTSKLVAYAVLSVPPSVDENPEGLKTTKLVAYAVLGLPPDKEIA